MLISDATLSVKYEARLEDGTLISKSPDEGVRFIVQEGMLHSVTLREFDLQPSQWLSFDACKSYLAGRFCPAITHAVKTMKIEEFVQMTVLPQCTVQTKL